MMRKKLFTFILTALVAIALFAPVSVEAAGKETVYGNLNLLTDTAGLLSDSQAADIQAKLESVSAEYQIGIFVVTVPDYRGYGYSDAFDYTDFVLREGYNLGYGSSGGTGDVLILMLSMSGRDYAILAHGDKGNRAFTDYGKEVMENDFLSYFGDNDWYGGFCAYISEAEYMLSFDANGTPFDYDTDPNNGVPFVVKLCITFLVPLLIAFVYVAILKGQMKSVFHATTAGSYIPEDGVHIACRMDRFTHRTQTRVRIENNSSKGGTTVHSSGSSGHSGKF